MLLLSIQPTYVEKIFAGTKTVELRKRRPNVEIGSRVIIYSTMPRCEIVGAATIGEISVSTPAKMWKEHRLKCGVTKQQFDSYFAGSEQAVGIHLCEPILFKNAFPLTFLRSIWPGFHPPQQFQYLAPPKLETLFNSVC